MPANSVRSDIIRCYIFRKILRLIDLSIIEIKLRRLVIMRPPPLGLVIVLVTLPSSQVPRWRLALLNILRTATHRFLPCRRLRVWPVCTAPCFWLLFVFQLLTSGATFGLSEPCVILEVKLVLFQKIVAGK